MPQTSRNTIYRNKTKYKAHKLHLQDFSQTYSLKVNAEKNQTHSNLLYPCPL